MQKSTAQARTDLAALQSDYYTLLNRKKVLSTLFKQIYEDKVIGRINDEQFVALAKKYTNITELTPEIHNTMIDKIVIGERESKHAKKVVKQKIRILFKGFGKLDDLMCV